MFSFNHSRQPIFIFASLLLAVSMILALLAALTLYHPVQAAPTTTYVSGPIITHTTWSLAGSPYIMTDSVTVNPGITLTIEPGVTVMGQLGTYLTVSGYIHAIGTPANPITFTSETNSGSGQWGGLSIGGSGATGNGHLKHVTIRYAEGNGLDNHLADGPFILENSSIQDTMSALGVSAASLHKLQMSNVSFINNDSNRVRISADWPADDVILTDNVTLTVQPGLEGYEVSFSGLGFDENFIVPAGITLTLKPGVTFMMSHNGRLLVDGYLEALGTAVEPITLTSALNSAPGNGLVCQ